MSENPTTWIPPTSGTVTTDNAGVIRTLQNGTQRLEQDGTVRVLQDNVVFGKISTTWSTI